MKKLLSLLLVVALIFSISVPVLADEPATDAGSETTTSATEQEESSVTEAEDAETEEDEDLTGAIVILHTNDVHGSIAGYAQVAAAKAKMEAAGAYVLLVDAGDYSQGNTAVSLSQGANAVELMNLAGYDAVTLGNHEFDYGYENLKTQMESAEFQVLAANVLYEGEVAFASNTVFTTEDGVKIGVFGLDTPETATKAHPAKIQGVTFLGGEELYACAQAQVDALKAEGCDYIICLGHLGIDDESEAGGNRSIDVLNNVTGIDVFIDGHSHSTYDEVLEATDGTGKVGDTYLTSTGTAMASLGIVVIKDGEIATETVALEELTDSDETVAARAQEILDEIEKEYGVEFATTEVTLNGERDPGVRTEETNLGDLICDALVWKAEQQGEEIDGAVTNGGGIRATIEAGSITKNAVKTVLPFGNTVSIVKVTGAELLEALEASTFSTPTAIGGFPQVSGIEYTVDTSVAYDQGELYPGDSTYYAPASIGRVTITSVGGEAFDPEATYTIATNDFLASGGDTYYAFAAAAVNYDLGISMDEAVMEYITEVLGGTVTAEQYGEPQGRITILESASSVFTDVVAGAWYEEFVNYVYKNNLMNGVSEDTFDLTGEVNTQTLVTVLYRLAGQPAVEGDLSAYTDGASVASWAQDAMIWATQNGIVTGTGTELEPTAAASRERVATILYRYFDSPAVEGADLSAYTDADEISSWAQAAMEWANVNGVITGSTTTTLSPAAGTTRAAMAKILTIISGLSTEEAAPEEETPAEGETTTEGETATEGETTAEGETPAEGETATEGETTTEGETATEGETTAEGETATEGETTTEGETAAETETTASETEQKAA